MRCLGTVQHVTVIATRDFFVDDRTPADAPARHRGALRRSETTGGLQTKCAPAEKQAAVAGRRQGFDCQIAGQPRSVAAGAHPSLNAKRAFVSVVVRVTNPSSVRNGYILGDRSMGLRLEPCRP